MRPPTKHLFARFTPDTDRWRRRVAAVAAVAAPLALYGTIALVSGTASGIGLTLATVVLAVLSLTLPAFAVAVLHAPASGLQDANKPMERLKRRYAAGEIDDREFERRLDRLVEADEHRRPSQSNRGTTTDARSDNNRHEAAATETTGETVETTDAR